MILVNSPKYRVVREGSDIIVLYKTSGKGGTDSAIKKRGYKILRDLGLSVGPVKIITKSVPDAFLGRCNIVTFESFNVTLAVVINVLSNNSLDDRACRQLLLAMLG